MLFHVEDGVNFYIPHGHDLGGGGAQSHTEGGGALLLHHSGDFLPFKFSLVFTFPLDLKGLDKLNDLSGHVFIFDSLPLFSWV